MADPQNTPPHGMEGSAQQNIPPRGSASGNAPADTGSMPDAQSAQGLPASPGAPGPDAATIGTRYSHGPEAQANAGQGSAGSQMGSSQAGASQAGSSQTGGSHEAGGRSHFGGAPAPGSQGVSGSSVPVSTSSSRGDMWPDMSAWLDTPYRAMRGFVDQVGRLAEEFGAGRQWMNPGFGRTLGREISSMIGSTGGMWSPEIEMYEREGAIVISADLPGMSRGDVNVEVTDDAVIIQGERRTSSRSDRNGIYRSERSYGRFHRRIPLPDGARTDEAQATFRDGVLEVVIPSPNRGGNRRRLDISDGPAGA